MSNFFRIYKIAFRETPRMYFAPLVLLLGAIKTIATHRRTYEIPTQRA